MMHEVSRVRKTNLRQEEAEIAAEEEELWAL